MKEGDFVNSLIKVANDMVDVTEQKASPEEVLASLQEIISQLETVAEAIPAESVATPQYESAVSDESLQQEVAQLKFKLAQREREELAGKYAGLFDESQHTAKTEEVLKSEKDNSYWLAKIENINEYTKSTTNGQTFQAKSFSYQKVAKQDSLYIL